MNNFNESSMENKTDSNIAYIFSPKLLNELDKISQISGRAEMVNSLINAYSLFDNLKVISPFKADEILLKSFHSQDYVNNLKKYSNTQDDEEDEFGIGYDCPIIENMFEFCSTIAGASLTAAHLINAERFKYVINWFGGWHHAKREKASGFCYINDIVLCILKLRQKFNRILYLDLDLHHGDGVQDAFEYTNKVICCSFHKYTNGFFPGTGSVEECGKGNGKFYTCNVPLQSGIDDDMFYDLFSKIFNKISDVYLPEVIVVQCGADSLYGDPIDLKNPFNLTLNGYCDCIKLILKKDIPTIFLGGGGYNFANTARLWCSITGLITNSHQLNKDIPEHENFLKYGPDYELSTSPGHYIRNKNSQTYVYSILNKIMENLDNIKFE